MKPVLHKTNLIVAVMLLGACGQDQDPSHRDAAKSGSPNKPECVAPSKPGGGFDLTCKLAQRGLFELDFLSRPMRISYQPGGIGAVAYNTVVTQRNADGNVIVAFSGGSLLNLAQGKFGKYTESDVRWIAAAGLDYGMLAVRSDSPLVSLTDLIDTLKNDPTSIVFGAGGTVGSQDWLKSAIIARSAGIDYRSMRYVAFEGGGEAQTALLGGHIQAYSGDISEAQGLLESGHIRVLAVMSDERLPAPFEEIPTAREQGYDFSWPILRGFYAGGAVSDRDYDWWVQSFNSMMQDPRFAEMRRAFGMFPYAKTGTDLEAVIGERMSFYRALVDEFDLAGGDDRT